MSLTDVVKSEAFLWGNNAEFYFNAAEAGIDQQWSETIWPLLSKYPVDLSRVIDFAVGRGRNTRKFLETGAESVTVVDVNDENLQYCRELFRGQPVNHVLNNGIDLAEIPTDSHSLFYCWDAMVHFDLLLIGGYLREIARVLRPGGLGFIHHSAYNANPGGDFQKNPHLRNYMTPELFRHFVVRNGLSVLEQRPMKWDVVTDCITVFCKPVRPTPRTVTLTPPKQG